MTIEYQEAGGWITATCDACSDDLTGMAWEDIQDLADDAHGFGGLVHIQMWNELGTNLALCRRCHHGYASTLAEVEAQRFADGEVFAIWAAKGWAAAARREHVAWAEGVKRLNARFGATSRAKEADHG